MIITILKYNFLTQGETKWQHQRKVVHQAPQNYKDKKSKRKPLLVIAKIPD